MSSPSRGDLQTLHFPAGAGIDQSTRPELIEPGTANRSQKNVRFTNKGSLSKAPGFQALTRTRLDSAGRTRGKRLISHEGSIVSIDGSQADLLSPDLGGWRPIGRVSEIGFRSIETPSFFDATAEDCTYCNGFYAITSWCANDSGSKTAVVSIISADTEEPAYANKVLDAGSDVVRPLVASISNRYIIAVWANGTVILASYFDTQAFGGGWHSIGTIASDFVGAPPSPMAIEQLSDRVAVVYSRPFDSGTSRLGLATFNITGVLESRTITTVDADIEALDVAGRSGHFGDTLWIGWACSALTSTDVNVLGVDPFGLGTIMASAAVVANPTTGSANMTIIPTTTGAGRIIVRAGGGECSSYLRSWDTSAGALNPLGSNFAVANFYPVARGFFHNDRCYVQCTTRAVSFEVAEVPQQTLVLVDVTENSLFLRPVVNHSMDTSAFSRGFQAKTVQKGFDEKLYSVVNRKKTASTVSAELAEYDFDPVESWSPANFQRCTYLSGGIVSYIDGDSVYEAGFLFRPPQPLESHASSGALTATIGYRYIYVWEHVDATGAVHQSGISQPSALSGAFTTQDVEVTMRPLTVTSRRQSEVSTVRIGLYRTTDGGQVFYRVATIAFDGTTDSILYTDTMTDATLQSKQKLYEQPGVKGTAQDHRAPSAMAHLESYGGFLVGAQGSNLFWSGQPIDGEGAWFSPLFQMPVEGEGPITGLAVLDGNIFVFKRRKIFITRGRPPVDNDSAGGLEDLRLLASDSGCTDARSLVSTAKMIFYRSERGIDAITRDGSVVWVGDKIQNILEEYPCVSAAVLDPLNDNVLFSLSSGLNGGPTGSFGVTLTYSLSFDAWESIDEHTSATGTVNTPAVSAAITQKNGEWLYSWLDRNGYVYRETPDQYIHADGTYVISEYTIPWAKLGLQQQMMIYSLMLFIEVHEACGFEVELTYNYGASTETKTFPAAEVVGKRQFELRPMLTNHYQSVTAVIREVAPVSFSTGQGLTFIGLSVDVALVIGDTKGTPPVAVEARK